MLRSFKLSAVVLLILTVFLRFSPSGNTPLVIAYFSGSEQQVSEIPAKKLDQIIYSFLHLLGNKLVVENATQDATIRALVDLKEENPQLKVLISLGGWGGCETCSDVFSSDKNRVRFAKSVAKILSIYGADGIDLDWEYPAIEGFPGHQYKVEDRNNFTLLLQTLRRTLGPEKVISFAAGGHDSFLDNSIDWPAVMKEVDHVNLMSYDLYNGNSKSTGHHTPLYSTDQQQLSTAHAVQELIKKGVSPQQIVVGGAFYGRVWENVSEEGNGLYQQGDFKESVAYKDLNTYFKEGFVTYDDTIAHSRYAYHKEGQLFVSFEDSTTLKEKIKFVHKEKLKGIMFWELTQDHQNELVEVLYNAVNAQ